MKVRKIERYKAKDNTDRWKIHFEGDDLPLIMGEQPSFKEGDDFPQDKLKRINKDNYSYYVLVNEPRQTKRYGRSPVENASIECQTVTKWLTEIFIAGKMEEFEASQSPLVKGLRRYAERRLIQDHPYTADALKGDE